MTLPHRQHSTDCAAASPHPLVARLASQVLASTLQAAGPVFAEQQLAGALGALADLAAGEALGGGCELDARGRAWRLANHLAAVLQVRREGGSLAVICPRNSTPPATQARAVL